MTREEIYAARFFGTALEWRIFGGGLILGALLGAVYDVLRALRMTIKHPAWLVFIEDVAFMLVSGAAYYSYCTELCRGQVRLFVLAAVLLGFSIYLLTLGRLVSRLVAEVVKFVKTALSVLGKLVKKIIVVLCGVPYFNTRSEKIEENPCTETDA